MAIITMFEASFAASLAAFTLSTVLILVASDVNAAAYSKAPAASKKDAAAEVSALATVDAVL